MTAKRHWIIATFERLPELEVFELEHWACKNCDDTHVDDWQLDRNQTRIQVAGERHVAEHAPEDRHPMHFPAPHVTH